MDPTWVDLGMGSCHARYNLNVVVLSMTHGSSGGHLTQLWDRLSVAQYDLVFGGSCLATSHLLSD